jgi:hypothetical protein
MRSCVGAKGSGRPAANLARWAIFSADERLRSGRVRHRPRHFSNCIQGGLGAVRTGCIADLAASSLSKTRTFNVAPAMSIIQKPETIPGASTDARQDVRLDVLSTCVDLISPSALANHNCIHPPSPVPYATHWGDTVARITLGVDPQPLDPPSTSRLILPTAEGWARGRDFSLIA